MGGRSSAGPLFTLTFEPEDGATKFTLDAEWHLPVPVVGAAVEALIVKLSEKEGDAMLANVKTEVEGGLV